MTDESDAPTGPLAGCRVLVTREHPGEFGRLLGARGADVVHVPLISVIDPPDGGEALAVQLARLDEFDWLVVTSRAGAERVGDAARRCTKVSLAAVGSATAEELSDRAGRSVDLLPDRQLALQLAADFNRNAVSPQRVLIAQGDRAADTVGAQLRSAGHDVTVVTAYSTVLVEPQSDVVADADVLALASGSAAEAWVAALGTSRPPIVVAIGPATANRARELGLGVDGVAAEHSIDGLVDEVVRQVVRPSVGK